MKLLVKLFLILSFCIISTTAFAATYTISGNVPNDIPAPAGRQIDNNGTLIDASVLNPNMGSYTFEVTPKEGSGQVYVSIPAAILAGLRLQMPAFTVNIEAPFGIYRLPVDIVDRLTDEDIDEGILRSASFRVTLMDKSTDTALLDAFQKSLPHAKPISGFVDFKLELIHTSSNEIIMPVSDYLGIIERLLPVSVAQIPRYYGIFCYNESTQNFDFTPHSLATYNDKPYVEFKIGGATIHVAAENDVPFNDVPATAWYASQVSQAASKALVRGVGNNSYQPSREVTRAEFAQMITNALLLPQAGGAPYEDVVYSQWFYNAIARCKAHGLLYQFTEKNFYPNRHLTREEMATILAAVLRDCEITSSAALGQFQDSVSMTTAYMPDIALVFGTGLMQGVAQDKFDPKGVTTRAQAATVLIRLLETLNMIDK